MSIAIREIVDEVAVKLGEYPDWAYAVSDPEIEMHLESMVRVCVVGEAKRLLLSQSPRRIGTAKELQKIANSTSGERGTDFMEIYGGEPELTATSLVGFPRSMRAELTDALAKLLGE